MGIHMIEIMGKYMIEIMGRHMIEIKGKYIIKTLWVKYKIEKLWANT